MAILAKTCRSDPWGTSEFGIDLMQQGISEFRKDEDWLGICRFAQAHCADSAVSTAEIYCLGLMYHWMGRVFPNVGPLTAGVSQRPRP